MMEENGTILLAQFCSAEEGIVTVLPNPVSFTNPEIHKEGARTD